MAGRVVLHRLSVQVQGPIDTTVTDPEGRFAFRMAADTAALFVLSTNHHGIEYFSRPLQLAPGGADTVTILAHDTSSSAPVALGERYVLVSRAAAPAARRAVLDLLIVRNRSPYTRAAPDTSRATWTLRLPEGAADLVAGEGEFSAAAFEQRGDTLRYLAPVTPGERQLVVRYTLPAAGELAFPMPGTADSVIVMLEDRDARVTTDGFTRGDSTVIEGQTYFRWTGRDGGEPVAVAFGGAGGTSPLPWLVGVLGLALAGGIVWAMRRRPAAPVAAAGAGDVTALVEAIARLDAEYGGREPELDEATRARYAAERARLRGELDRALAARGTGR
jgi:hypothetical protein